LLYYQYEPFRYFVKASARCYRAGIAGLITAIDYKWALRHLYETQKSEVHQRSALRVLRCLMKSGGIYIKLGQHLSAMTYILPKEWTETMRPLQDQCPESPLEDLDQLMIDDLGQSLEQLFTEFDPRPLGVASLAQVHRAVLRENGQEVAVKVQHPYLDEFSKIDLRTVSLIIGLAEDLFPEFQFGWLRDEMNVSLPQELDFVREKNNAQRVERNFADVARCPLAIPHVFWAHRRIMAMEYINGSRIDDKAYMQAHKINPDQVATELTRIFSEMIFIHGWVHCDPHPGNILVRTAPPASSARSGYNFEIVLLDHGLYRELSSEFRMNYAYMWRALMAGDETGIRRYSKLLAGTDLYIVFSCILTGRDWRVIQNDLNQALTDDEVNTVFEKVPYLLVEIIDVLATVPRELLLLFKTNDLLRSVDQSIRSAPSPAMTMAIMGRYCTKAIYNETMFYIRQHARILGYTWSLLGQWVRCQWQY
ncbi:ABC1 family-domain-containing protein, partial [Dimargaris cristalligena]